MELKYIGTFCLTLRHFTDQAFGNNKYLCHAFDKGTIWSFQSMPESEIHLDPFVVHFVEAGSVMATFIHDDPTRKSFNQINLKLPFGHIVLPKPKSVVEGITYSSQQTMFFLQDSAFSKVDEYFKTVHGGKSWILHPTLFNNYSTGSFSFDFNLLQQLTLIQPVEITLDDEDTKPIIVADPVDAPSLVVPTLAAPALARTGVKLLGQTVSPVTGGTNPTNEVDYQVGTMFLLPNTRYPLLAEAEVDRITYCKTCLRHFTFVTEFVLHFDKRPNCFKVIKDKFPSFVSFYKALSEFFRAQCGNPPMENRSCNSCSLTFSSTLNYCLHRDQHNFHTLYPCVFCTGVFNIPYLYYRHSCPREVAIQSMPPRTLSTMTSNRAYPSLILSEVSKLLFCTSCGTQFNFASQLVRHLSVKKTCLQEITKNDKNGVEFYLDAMSYSQNQILLSKVYCNQCDMEYPSKWSYLLHWDHHKFLSSTEVLTCSRCKVMFRSPCLFFRHCCNKPTVWCHFCEKMDLVKETPAKGPEVNSIQISLSESLALRPMELQQVAGLWNNHSADQSMDVSTADHLNEFDSNELDDITVDFSIKSDPDAPMLTIDQLPPIPPTAIKSEPVEHDIQNSVLTQVFSDVKQELMDPVSVEEMPESLDDVYICRSCNPLRFLKSTEKMSEHLEANTTHFDISPLSAFNDFSLRIADVAKSFRHGDHVQSELRRLSNKRRKVMVIPFKNFKS